MLNHPKVLSTLCRIAFIFWPVYKILFFLFLWLLHKAIISLSSQVCRQLQQGGSLPTCSVDPRLSGWSRNAVSFNFMPNFTITTIISDRTLPSHYLTHTRTSPQLHCFTGLVLQAVGRQKTVWLRLLSGWSNHLLGWIHVCVSSKWSTAALQL